MLKRLASQMGIEDDRLRLEWISASEGERVRTVMNDMVGKIRALGPLGRLKDEEGAREETVVA